MTRRRRAIAKQIRRRRVELGIGLNEIYEALGVSRWTYDRWESGAVSIPCEALVTIAGMLKLDVAELANAVPAPRRGSTIESISTPSVDAAA